MMRMFGLFVCISTLRVFSEVAALRAGMVSGSARLLLSGKGRAPIERLSGVFTATFTAWGVGRLTAGKELFRR